MAHDDGTPAPAPRARAGARGLSDEEAAARLAEHGPNALPETPPEPLLRRFARQFRSPLIYILVFALVVDLAIWLAEGAAGLPIESIAIALILLLNAGLGTWQERKAEAALARLRAMAASRVWVLRGGALVRRPATELVPGDLVRLDAGDRVPADGVLADARGVLIDESMLTGESIPVDRDGGDRAISGTLLVRGRTWLEVERTGTASAMGRLATMIGTLTADKTPLERRLERFGNQVAWAMLALALVVLAGGVAIEGWSRIGHVFLFAVALAVAAVPEGLPAVLTLTLALGVERMAGRKAVVRRLSAVEALGSVTVIATDKTGTLTENRMSVREVDLVDRERALQAMVLANDADVGTGAGDPLELALLDHARMAGIDAEALRAAHPRIGGRAFDSGHKYMHAVVRDGSGETSHLKGAPEVLLARSRLDPAARAGWARRAEDRAHQGHRVIALGAGRGPGDDQIEFLGLAMLWDPPRPEAHDAVRAAEAAGIRVVMVTGDHPATALAVARAVGIVETRAATGAEVDSADDAGLAALAARCRVFARMAPEHKLRLVECLRARGEVVAVTGDGVNDAPALKRADVGVAMGLRGSEVAREVADLVLLDDNFATIVAAIEEGRGIYDNIQKFIRFLFSTNFALVLLVVGGAAAALALDLREAGALFLPLTAAQLLWINIIADGPPALALALDRNPGVMARPPRDPSAPLLDRASLTFILATGAIKAVLGLGLLVGLPRAGWSLVETRSAVFLYESIAQLAFAYPSRRIGATPPSNAALHVAVAAGIALQAMTVTVPWLRELLGLEPASASTWGWVTAAAATSLALAALVNRLAPGAGARK